MRIKSRHRLEGTEGFTLMELVVVIVIMGILALVVTGITSFSARTFSRVFNSTQVRWELRNAMERLQRDFRRLSPDSLLRIEPNRVTFYDIDHQYVDIQLARGELRRNGEVILKNVTNTNIFSYFNQNMQAVTGKSAGGEDDDVDDDKFAAAASPGVGFGDREANHHFSRKKKKKKRGGGDDDGDDDEIKKRKQSPYHEVAYVAVTLKVTLSGHEGTLQELFYVRN